MWIMITGIKNAEEALRAWELGVDALGLLVKQANDSNEGFISSKFAVSITKCLFLLSKSSSSLRMVFQQQRQDPSFSSQMDNLKSLPNPPGRIEHFCENVLVTHLIDVQKIVNLANTIGVRTIQIVGDITPEEIHYIKGASPGIKVIKSIHVTDHSYIDKIKKYMNVVDVIELDIIDTAAKKFGGTGKTHEWTINSKIVQEYGHKVPIILAGGLALDNIEESIQIVKPFDVDVISDIKDDISRNTQNM
jgi:phosphoribosylanthranilate isomerase